MTDLAALGLTTSTMTTTTTTTTTTTAAAATTAAAKTAATIAATPHLLAPLLHGRLGLRLGSAVELVLQGVDLNEDESTEALHTR